MQLKQILTAYIYIQDHQDRIRLDSCYIELVWHADAYRRDHACKNLYHTKDSP